MKYYITLFLSLFFCFFLEEGFFPFFVLAADKDPNESKQSHKKDTKKAAEDSEKSSSEEETTEGSECGGVGVSSENSLEASSEDEEKARREAFVRRGRRLSTVSFHKDVTGGLDSDEETGRRSRRPSLLLPSPLEGMDNPFGEEGGRRRRPSLLVPLEVLSEASLRRISRASSIGVEDTGVEEEEKAMRRARRVSITSVYIDIVNDISSDDEDKKDDEDKEEADKREEEASFGEVERSLARSAVAVPSAALVTGGELEDIDGPRMTRSVSTSTFSLEDIVEFPEEQEEDLEEWQRVRGQALQRRPSIFFMNQDFKEAVRALGRIREQMETEEEEDKAFVERSRKEREEERKKEMEKEEKKVLKEEGEAKRRAAARRFFLDKKEREAREKLKSKVEQSSSLVGEEVALKSALEKEIEECSTRRRESEERLQAELQQLQERLIRNKRKMEQEEKKLRKLEDSVLQKRRRKMEKIEKKSTLSLKILVQRRLEMREKKEQRVPPLKVLARAALTTLDRGSSSENKMTEEEAKKLTEERAQARKKKEEEREASRLRLESYRGLSRLEAIHKEERFLLNRFFQQSKERLYQQRREEEEKRKQKEGSYKDTLKSMLERLFQEEETKEDTKRKDRRRKKKTLQEIEEEEVKELRALKERQRREEELGRQLTFGEDFQKREQQEAERRQLLQAPQDPVYGPLGRLEQRQRDEREEMERRHHREHERFIAAQAGLFGLTTARARELMGSDETALSEEVMFRRRARRERYQMEMRHIHEREEEHRASCREQAETARHGRDRHDDSEEDGATGGGAGGSHGDRATGGGAGGSHGDRATGGGAGALGSMSTSKSTEGRAHERRDSGGKNEQKVARFFRRLFGHTPNTSDADSDFDETHTKKKAASTSKSVPQKKPGPTGRPFFHFLLPIPIPDHGDRNMQDVPKQEEAPKEEVAMSPVSPVSHLNPEEVLCTSIGKSSYASSSESGGRDTALAATLNAGAMAGAHASADRVKTDSLDSSEKKEKSRHTFLKGVANILSGEAKKPVVKKKKRRKKRRELKKYAYLLENSRSSDGEKPEHHKKRRKKKKRNARSLTQKSGTENSSIVPLSSTSSSVTPLSSTPDESSSGNERYFVLHVSEGPEPPDNNQAVPEFLLQRDEYDARAQDLVSSEGVDSSEEALATLPVKRTKKRRSILPKEKPLFIEYNRKGQTETLTDLNTISHHLVQETGDILKSLYLQAKVRKIKKDSFFSIYADMQHGVSFLHEHKNAYSAQFGVIITPYEKVKVGFSYNYNKDYISKAGEKKERQGYIKSTVRTQTVSSIVAWNTNSPGLTGHLEGCYGLGTARNTRDVRYTHNFMSTKGRMPLKTTALFARVGYRLDPFSCVAITPYVEARHTTCRYRSYKEHTGLLPAKVSINKGTVDEGVMGLSAQFFLSEKVLVRTWLEGGLGRKKLQDAFLEVGILPIILVPAQQERYKKVDVGCSIDMYLTTNIGFGVYGSVDSKSRHGTFKLDHISTGIRAWYDF